MQSPELMNISIVVLASDHNPTILNPDFLLNTGIISKDLGWNLAESPITTPPFASVKYDSGVSILVEPNKLQVTHEGVSNPVDSEIGNIVKNYMNTLQYVQYKAIGINFVGIVAVDDASTFMKEHFLNDKIKSDNGLDSIGIKLLYSTNAGDRFTLELDAAIRIVQSEEGQQTVIVSKGNFNKDCSGNSSLEEIIEGFPVISDCWNQYLETLNRVLD